MSRKKKNSLNELTQITGKISTNQPTTLDQIWGESGMSKYGNLTEEEYKEKINEFSRNELEIHARQIGVIVSEETDRLRNELLKEYRIFKQSLSIPYTSLGKNNKETVDKLADAVLKEGR
jgi:hypothetical protein